MIFNAALRPVRIASVVPRAAIVQRRAQSTSVFARDNFAKYAPDLKLSGETTLGEVWDKAYVKYRYRLVYPIVAWVGFLYWQLWIPYADPKEKAAARARLDHLESLNFHQV
ncbi:hypothetical protein HKX48_001760 [Thoreauomyces humboldtii]|nr:hypothetical protein HKX48_001760 [Thoreauomyces humboldtii]